MKISLKLLYLLNLLLDSHQYSTAISLGQFDYVFGDFESIFKIIVLVCRISLDPMDGFSPNLYRCSTWTSFMSCLDFGDLDLIFKVTGGLE